jgi:hypothetical protein
MNIFLILRLLRLRLRVEMDIIDEFLALSDGSPPDPEKVARPLKYPQTIISGQNKWGKHCPTFIFPLKK